MSPILHLARVVLVAALLVMSTANDGEARQQEKRAGLECGERCEIRLSTNRLLEVRHDEPDVRLRFGGRFHLDGAATFDDLTPMDDGWRVRRARPEFRARLFEVVNLKVDYEFAPDRQGWRNVWARVTPHEAVWVQGGNFITPFGLEEWSSSNHLLFMERALPSALAPGFQTGGAIGVRGKLGRSNSRHRFTLATMVGTAPFSSGEDDRHKSEHVSISARATYAPLARRKRVFHLGGSFEWRSLQTGSVWRVRSRPESSIAEAILGTVRLGDVDSTISGAGEVAWIHRSLSVQAEAITTRLRRTGAPDALLWGAYGQVGWIVTGEHRRYSRNTARIRGPVPDRLLGAVELGVRVSHLDLIDQDIAGGRATDVTAGVNWYLRQNLRLMANYVFVDARVRGSLAQDRPHIVQGRFAVFF